MSKHMIHFNGDLLCAVDVETTGLKAGYHDVIQVCILPLDSNIQPYKKILPFYVDLRPKFPENADPIAMRVHRKTMSYLTLHGIEPYRAADLFDEWFAKLGLALRKRIIPLGASCGFDEGFLRDWLGDETYDQYFSFKRRDIQTVANFLNDRAGFKGEPAPFPKVNVTYLASQLEISHSRAHDAQQDCLVEAEIYRRMVRLLT